METKIIETEGAGNWGKFLVGRFTDEREYKSALSDPDAGYPLARWDPSTVLVLDLATGKGALFTPWGWAEADLRKHQVWVCPMFEGFLGWLYRQDLADLQALPALVEIPDHTFSLVGRRRHGLLGEALALMDEVGSSAPRLVQARELIRRAHTEGREP